MSCSSKIRKSSDKTSELQKDMDRVKEKKLSDKNLEAIISSGIHMHRSSFRKILSHIYKVTTTNR
jgi:predicted site-specific integrase-resolvase